MFTNQEKSAYIAARRQKVLEQMAPNSILLLFSGAEQHISLDAYHHFEVNKNFFYLTGIQRDIRKGNGSQTGQVLQVLQKDRMVKTAGGQGEGRLVVADPGAAQVYRVSHVDVGIVLDVVQHGSVAGAAA